MSDCIFCKIISRKIPADIIYETKNTLAFSDINPQAPVHILVIPKTHISSITKIEAEHKDIISEIIETIKNITEKRGISSSGFRVVANHGEDSGQAVPHLHFHILGGRKLTWPPG